MAAAQMEGFRHFPRGGSDVTGSIVAKAVLADIYENWTDVSGVLVADPRIIENPKPIHTVTYKELRELSYMGASVLHEDALFSRCVQRGFRLISGIRMRPRMRELLLLKAPV